jgi:hypothetical protein
MKKTLLAAGVALAVLGGVGSATAQVAVGVTFGHPGYYHRHHYWWHGRWYGYRPYGYYYVAPPYPYYGAYYSTYRHPYYRHYYRGYRCRDWDRDGDCH